MDLYVRVSLNLCINHFDGYVEYLGEKILSFIKNHTNEELIECFERLTAVDGDSLPSGILQEKYIKLGLYDPKVSTGSPDKWYALLRNLQGNLEAWFQGCEHFISVDPNEDHWQNYTYTLDLDSFGLTIDSSISSTISFDEIRTSDIDKIIHDFNEKEYEDEE